MSGGIVDEYEKYGLPICMDSEVTFPHGHGPESFKFLMERDKDVDTNGVSALGILQAQLMFTWIALALGVPALIEGDTANKSRVVPSTDLFAAGARALKVQRGRNTRIARSF